MKYRDYYKSFFKIEFDGLFDVHHLNCNRNDNNISNLLLLPNCLHRTTHNIIYNLSLNQDVYDYIFYIASIDEKLLCQINEIRFWFDLKEQAMIEINNAISEGREYVNFYQCEINKFYNNIK